MLVVEVFEDVRPLRIGLIHWLDFSLTAFSLEGKRWGSLSLGSMESLAVPLRGTDTGCCISLDITQLIVRFSSCKVVHPMTFSYSDESPGDTGVSGSGSVQYLHVPLHTSDDHTFVGVIR